MAEYALRNDFATNKELINHIEMIGLPSVSVKTVSSYLRKEKVTINVAAEKPNLTEEAMFNRVETSLLNMLVPRSVFRRTVFIDKFSIDTRMKRKTQVKRRRGQRYDQQNINRCELRNPKTQSFVCCFSYQGVGPIEFIEGRFTAEKYLNFLQNQVLPFYDPIFDNYYLLHDNARIHTARIVQDFLRAALSNRVHSHPAYSPDLNPIEHLGNALKRKVCDQLKQSNVQDHNNLRNMIKDQWQEFDDNIEFLQSLVDSLHSRYNQCVSAMGNATRY